MNFMYFGWGDDPASLDFEIFLNLDLVQNVQPGTNKEGFEGCIVRQLDSETVYLPIPFKQFIKQFSTQTKDTHEKITARSSTTLH